MSGRGDNNKQGSSGQGSSKQSGQGHEPHGEKMNHSREQTGGEPSQKQKPHREQDSNRNTSTERDGNASI